MEADTIPSKQQKIMPEVEQNMIEKLSLEQKKEQTPLTLAQQRMMITPQSNQSWFEGKQDEQGSDLSLEDSDNEEAQKQDTSNLTNTSNILKVFQQKEKSYHKRYASKQGQIIQQQQHEQSQDLAAFQHKVDSKYLVLLSVMRSKRLININKIAGLSKGYIQISSRKNAICIRTNNAQEANQAIERISNFIDQLSVISFAYNQNIRKIMLFGKIYNYFIKKNIAIFTYQSPNSKGKKEMCLGGLVKQNKLRQAQMQLKSYKITQFYMKAFKHQRSYCIIINKILNFPYVTEQLYKFNQINFVEVKSYCKERQMRILISAVGNKDVSPNDYQQIIMKQVRKFYVLVFCYYSRDRFIQKLSVPGISFLVIHQHKLNRSYLIVIGLKEDFYSLHEQIQIQIAKLGPKIVGVRFFNNLQPLLSSFTFSNEEHYIVKYPLSRPYSTAIISKKRGENVFNWRQFYHNVVGLKDLKERKIRERSEQ